MLIFTHRNAACGALHDNRWSPLRSLGTSLDVFGECSVVSNVTLAYQSASSCSCAPSWEDEGSQSYNWYLLTIGFFFPMSVILFTSGAVIVYLKRVKRRTTWLPWLQYRAKGEKRPNFETFSDAIWCCQWINEYSYDLLDTVAQLLNVKTQCL